MSSTHSQQVCNWFASEKQTFSRSLCCSDGLTVAVEDGVVAVEMVQPRGCLQGSWKEESA